MAAPAAAAPALGGLAGGRGRRKVAWVGGLAAAALLFAVALPLLLVTTVLNPAGGGLGSGAGLPAGAQPFLSIYEDAAKAYKVSPFLLMAVHEDETAFSTSPAPGVRNGVNFAGCCAGPMQFYIAGGASPQAGGSGATWGGYSDGYRRARIARPASYPGRFAKPRYATPNVYDSFDAIYAAASYFHGLGAGPELDSRTLNALASYKGTPPASLPFARADYQRALEFQRISAANGGGAGTVAPAFGNRMVRVGKVSPWLGRVPGYPGELCDRRILPNLTYLIQRYKLAITDCHATSGHARDGEHPLGLGVDIVPGPGGSWELVDQLARAAEPQQNNPRPPFRWVGYNGDAAHGRGHHLHLSWDHAPAEFNTQAAWALVAAG